MYDRFDRRINYLRVSVTDRCDQRCVYCMPPEGVKLHRHEGILSFEEITDVVRAAVRLGVDPPALVHAAHDMPPGFMPASSSGLRASFSYIALRA